jgi:hypothetical protein
LGKHEESGYIVMVHGKGVLMPDEQSGGFVERGLYAKRIIRGGTELAAREAAIRLVADELMRIGCKLDDARSSIVVDSVTRGLLKRTAPAQIFGFTFYGAGEGASDADHGRVDAPLEIRVLDARQRSSPRRS